MSEDTLVLILALLLYAGVEVGLLWAILRTVRPFTSQLRGTTLKQMVAETAETIGARLEVSLQRMVAEGSPTRAALEASVARGIAGGIQPMSELVERSRPLVAAALGARGGEARKDNDDMVGEIEALIIQGQPMAGPILAAWKAASPKLYRKAMLWVSDHPDQAAGMIEAAKVQFAPMLSGGEARGGYNPGITGVLRR